MDEDWTTRSVNRTAWTHSFVILVDHSHDVASDAHFAELCNLALPLIDTINNRSSSRGNSICAITAATIAASAAAPAAAAAAAVVPHPKQRALPQRVAPTSGAGQVSHMHPSGRQASQPGDPQARVAMTRASGGR